MMRPADLVRSASGALRSNPLRSALTALGVIIGVASVIAVVALGRGAEANIQRSISSLGSNLLVVVPGVTRQGRVLFARGTWNSLKLADADAIRREIDGVSVVAPNLRSPALQIVGQGANWNTRVEGVTPDYLVARDWQIAQGRMFEDAEERQAKKVVVLGATVAGELFGGQDGIGQSVRINGGAYEVIGILESKGQAGIGEDQDDTVLAPLNAVKRRMFGGWRRDSVSQISVKVAPDADMDRVQADIETLLRARHRIRPGEDDDFTVQNVASVAQAAAETSRVFTYIIAAIAGISLLVGGIGIMNIMLVSVTERTREIGLRKALGAERRGDPFRGGRTDRASAWRARRLGGHSFTKLPSHNKCGLGGARRGVVRNRWGSFRRFSSVASGAPGSNCCIEAGMKRGLLFLCATLAAAPNSAAAETLRDAMEQALETNPSIEAQRARLAASREALPQARSEALPQLSADASATRTESDQNGGGFIPGGGGQGNFSNDSDNWSAGLSASQLLFASGRVAGSVRQARAGIRAAEANYVGSVQNLLLDVTAAYAQLREARSIVEARQRQADNLEEQRRFAEARFNAGLATRTDLAQAQARLAQARTQLIQAQGALAAANETYQRVVGAPATELEPAPPVAGLPESLEQALEIAVRSSPTLEAARASEDAAAAAVRVAAAGRGPTVSLTAGTRRNGEFEDNVGEFGSDSVGLRLSIPFFSGGFTSSRVREQRALRSAASLERANAERLLRETVTTAWTAVDTSRAAYRSALEQLEAAELAYRGVRLEQEVGLRATVEALDQENDLLAARLAVAAAERDVAVAERRLAAAVGNLREPR